MMCFASGRVWNQLVSRHSALKVERFAEGVVRWLAWTREVDLHCIAVSPQIHQLTGELGPIVTEQHFRHTSLLLQPVQHAHHIFPSQTLSYFNRQALE